MADLTVGHGHPYCAYLTVYFGNKLPPLYIGHTTVRKIRDGYHGSVRSKEYRPIWDKEIKEHPELFKTIVLSEHATREEAIDREISFQRKLNVLDNPLYANRAIGRLVDNRGRKHSPEFVAMRAAAMRGRPAWNKGIPNPANADRNRQRCLGVKNPEHSARMKGRKNPAHSEMLKAKYASGWSPRVGKKHSEETRAKIKAARWPDRVAA